MWGKKLWNLHITIHYGKVVHTRRRRWEGSATHRRLAVEVDQRGADAQILHTRQSCGC